MKNKEFYVGFDIGTDSVGYAVTDKSYNLCKFKGEPMWGSALFEEAQTAVERRGYRSARRRLDRKQQRVRLIGELFAPEIAKTDEDFFRRIKESYLYPETENDKIRLFDTYKQQKEYENKYPTIHHLILDLMQSGESHDVRLVYIACAWLVAHRGHFLSEVDKHNIDAVTDFKTVFESLNDFICRDGEYALPWKSELNIADVEEALKSKLGIIKKTRALKEALFGKEKVPKEVNEQYEYNYELVVKLLCGGKAGLAELFGKEEYADLEENSVKLNLDDEKIGAVMQSIGDDAALIAVLKGVYDWSVLADILNGRQSISEAKVDVYNQHKNDLKELKYLTKKYLPEKYDEIFRDKKVKNNYVAYIGKNKTANKTEKVKKDTANREEFCKYILSAFKSVKPDETDEIEYDRIKSRLEVNDFMPKQVDGDNRVIPYQIYWYELNKILENASEYLPLLKESDEDGITGAEKVLSVFEFRVPYYVGPLKEKSNPKWNHWMVRRAEGRIYPWNFESKVDLDKSEEAFISRMTNCCTYLPGEDVLPKNSLIYCAFEVLNEINNIKINGNDIPVSVKQEIYNNVFTSPNKVTPKRIKNYLVSNNYMSESDQLNGIDIAVNSSLKPFAQFKNLLTSGILNYSQVESIINRAAYSEDKARFSKWLKREYPDLSESDVKYITGLKLKNFGRLSKRLLCGIEGVDKESGEVYTSIIRAMWETNYNLMQLLSDKFTFTETINGIVGEYYGGKRKSVSERLDEMYASNSVKRPIIRTLDILKDIVKVQGQAPERIFIEMARGAKDDQKGRKDSRLQQILELYKKVRDEDIPRLTKELEDLGDTAHNRLQSDKLFLYFIQLGRCLYTGKKIEIESVLSGDGTYNIEHIYPRSFVKDDSVINNEILVDSKVNGDKSDNYPVKPEIQEKMGGYWKRLKDIGLMSDEKFKRLTRTTHFTNDEKFEFINRQLVETRQSTKAIAELLKEMYPKTEIVYVKAGLVSDFRQQFDLPKSRMVNDLHHAKDAYLNIVTGNVWHCKFSRQFWRREADNNAKVEIVFTKNVKCKEETVWNGAQDKDRVVEIARKNTAHVTKYAFCRKGGYFDQMPVSAAKGLVPLKKDRPTEIYGGYNKSTASFFVLVRYKIAKKQDIMVMPVELLYADKFLQNDAFAVEYAKKTVSDITGAVVESVEFLLNKRIIKVNTVFSLNGFKVCITGKNSGGKCICVSCLSPFKTSRENEAYIKRLESFEKKRRKNNNIVFSEKHDRISAEKNLELYDYYMDKMQNKLYKNRPTNPYDIIVKGRERFIMLSPEQQVTVLLSIQGLFGRANKVDLSLIGGGKSVGMARLSSSVSNWKKYYTDVRIIDRSTSGLFEKVSENLLELL